MWEGRASPSSSSSGLVLLGRLPTSRRTSLPTQLSQTTDCVLDTGMDTWTDLGNRQRKHDLVTVRHKKMFLSYPKSKFAEWMGEFDLLKNRLASMEGALA